MPQDANVVIRFKDIENNDEIREVLEARCRHIAQGFPETRRYEVSLGADSNDVSAHAHVVGKGIDLAAHASTPDPRTSGELALDRLQRELRREHDKRIFAHRREARRSTDRNRPS